MLVFGVDNMDDTSDSVTYMATVDHDISRMENLLDQWTAELKKNVMVLSDYYAYMALLRWDMLCKRIVLILLFLCCIENSKVVIIWAVS